MQVASQISQRLFFQVARVVGEQAVRRIRHLQALAILQREKSVALVITDYSMPHMDGFALAKAINSSWPTLPIIIATGYAALPVFADLDCPKLNKPYRQEELEHAIALALNDNGALSGAKTALH